MATFVSAAILTLKNRLLRSGTTFGHYVPVLLTDNGSEFSHVHVPKQGPDRQQETHVFFCHPECPDDKAHVEKIHTLLRDICPKRTSFDPFTQDTVNEIVSYINSTARKLLHGKPPYEIFSFLYGEEAAYLFGIRPISATSIVQTPLLLEQLQYTLL